MTQLIRLSSRDASRVVRKCAFNHTRLLLYANVDQSPLSRHGHVLSTNRSRTSLNSHFLINVQCYICYFIFGLYLPYFGGFYTLCIGYMETGSTWQVVQSNTSNVCPIFSIFVTGFLVKPAGRKSFRFQQVMFKILSSAELNIFRLI